MNPALAVQQTLDLMVQRAYWVMNNDVLIAVPLFVFMGYLVERANLIQALFKGLHLATARIPGSLAVATVITCAIFATASGIIGAVVTLMGLLAFPAMLKAGYNIRLVGGRPCAGGTLGHPDPALGPPDPLRRHRRRLGRAALRRGVPARLMLALLYVGYIIIYAKLKPSIAPPLSEEDQYVPLPKFAEVISTTKSNNVLVGLLGAIKGKRNADVPMKTIAQPSDHRHPPAVGGRVLRIRDLALDDGADPAGYGGRAGDGLRGRRGRLKHRGRPGRYRRACRAGGTQAWRNPRPNRRRRRRLPRPHRRRRSRLPRRPRRPQAARSAGAARASSPAPWDSGSPSASARWGS